MELKKGIKIKCEHCGTLLHFVDISKLTCSFCDAPLRVNDSSLLTENLFSKVANASLLPLRYIANLTFESEILPLNQMASHIIDISKWQYKWDGNKWVSPDFDKMKNETDMIHVIHKASQGILPDPCYQIGVQEMSDRNIRFGTYHYCDPRLNPVDSADVYASQINAIPLDQQWGTQKYPQHWLDCESRIGPGGNPLSNSELTSWIKSFVDRLEQLTDQYFGIYTREIWWNDYILRNAWAHYYALWIARYNSWITDPGAPLDWSNYGKVASLWQRDADGNGLGSQYGVWSKSIDRNKSPIYTQLEIESIINNNQEPPVNIVPPDYIVAKYYDGDEYIYIRD